MGCCTYSWVKNVESYWSIGTGIGLYGCYRCEVRDSFMHETPSPNPGGGGYLSGMNIWSSDCLFENCIMWQGNKQIVMRGAGSGNVVGYCYMDDAFGSTYPESPEAGANAAHYGTTLFPLIEGCYSHNYQGDTFWGGSYCVTVHRNWLSGIRGCSPTGTTASNSSTSALQSYTTNQGGTIYPYGDYLGRRMVDIDYGSINHNFVGNVLGLSGQSLLTYTSATFNTAQTQWVYEQLDTNPNQTTDVTIWSIGTYQPPTGGFTWVGGTYGTQLRSGNWDWHSSSQQWHGIGGSNEYGGNLGLPYPAIPNSYYIAGTPAFFTSSSYAATTFPWVNPNNGSTAVQPARARWLNNTPNTL
jgi:hypothetical protein